MSESRLVQLFGSGVILKHLEALLEEVGSVRENTDIESLHRMRVACRRLRSLLPVFGPFLAGKRYKRWRRAFRRLGRTLGAARDTDVHIERVRQFLAGLEGKPRLGVGRLLLRLQQQRAQLQKAVLEALGDFEQTGVAEEMIERLAPLAHEAKAIEWGRVREASLAQLARNTILERLQSFLELSSYVERPECVAELHLMRIRAKHLRYTLEAFAPLFSGTLKPYIQAARASQDMLGAIHDNDVWLVFLPQFIEQERQRTLEYYGHGRVFPLLRVGLDLYYRHCKEERETIYVQFCEAWHRWEQEGLWSVLQTIPYPMDLEVIDE